MNFTINNLQYLKAAMSIDTLQMYMVRLWSVYGQTMVVLT